VKIVVDENIPYGREAFSSLGEVVLRAGRAISREDLGDADLLCVRSVTKVNAALLDGTPVRFVASATIGTDHLDREYLERAGIHYCNAPGCNADSVADYVTAALLAVAEIQGAKLEGKSIGVIGCGNVGSRVVRRARVIGMTVLENDPPLARQSGDPRYRPLQDLFGADYLTLHTPLTHEGQDATFHLAGESFLRKMRPEAILLNTSRGAVADGAALKEALREDRLGGAVLDVWEGEPEVDVALAERVEIATPHIAGYSLEGKTNGTLQIYRQACAWLGIEPIWSVEPLLPEPDVPVIEMDAEGRSDEELLRAAVFQVYPIRRDDAALRAALRQADAAARGRAFDRLRKEYPRRREFSRTTVRLRHASPALAEKFRGITFRVSENV